MYLIIYFKINSLQVINNVFCKTTEFQNRTYMVRKMAFIVFITILEGKSSYLVWCCICCDTFIACVEGYNDALASHRYIDGNGRVYQYPFQKSMSILL